MQAQELKQECKVTHGAFEVNGKKVDIPSYLVKAGDVIALREIRKDNGTVKMAAEENASRPVPTWLEKDSEALRWKSCKISFKRRH